ncbi:MAG: hypothetical protein VX951_11985, partial [Planctomycetota bacterium]|nr:hypothetical protein [Planctomycetota bacterium]
LGANIRVAIATEGPLALPGVHEDKITTLNGNNNDGFISVIRDFRSGTSLDNSSEFSRGFLRDPHPPRLLGEMLMYVVRVDAVNSEAKLITIFKDSIEHELDRGDLLRLFVDDSGVPIAAVELLEDPADDLGEPETQRVQVMVRPVLDANGEDLLELIDPSNRAGFPPLATPQQEEWLRQNAPKAVLVCEYTHRRLHPVQPDPNTPVYYGDDPRNFLSFSPRPLANDLNVIVNNQNISPFAGALLRFSKPIDISTIIASDTAFFATRDVFDQAAIDDFVTTRGIEPSSFDEDKFRTPHLIQGQVFDSDGSQTTIRIQPTLGLYLDQAMRDAAEADKALPFSERRYHYFLHIVGGMNGISDLAGNALDFQAASGPGLEIVENAVLEFALDTRIRPNTTEPRYPDNIVIYLVRRFQDADEDERPNYYQPGEITPVGSSTPAAAWRSNDLFGPVSFLPSGELIGRAATRTRKVVDSLNQQSPPPQNSELRWCPVNGPTGFGSPTQIVNRTAGIVFGQPIRNPINPFGCRLQMVWREIDMSLSRTDPLDFNLDVEQLYWAPFAADSIVFDEFDRVSLYLGHSEFRPEPCISSGDAFPSMPVSGLDQFFERNYVHNNQADGNIGHKPDRHPAFLDAVLTINATDAVLETNGVNRYLPLPKFLDASKTTNLRNPYFVWRDEQEVAQGGANGLDVVTMSPYPYLLSPFLGGLGNRVTGTPGNLNFLNGGWDNAGLRNPTRGRQLRTGQYTDTRTGGCVGTIALPLLADFWVHPDDPDLPTANPFHASGINGWQVSVSVQSSAKPDFRIYSAGRVGTGNQIDPTSTQWQQASGGFQPGGIPTLPGDNTVYWVMADFLKRTSVVTSGFVDIANPHRMPAGGDPRLGPYDLTDKLPTYTYDFEPPLSNLPPGTGVVAQFRGASKITRPNQWWPPVGTNAPTTDNFPLDPLKAGDAHIHHWDNRNIQGTGTRRRWFSYLYNETVTSYTEDPNDLTDLDFTDTFSGPNESFKPEDVQYFNWRFLLKNNVEVTPPVAPKIQAFSCAYRLSKQ